MLTGRSNSLTTSVSDVHPRVRCGADSRGLLIRRLAAPPGYVLCLCCSARPQRYRCTSVGNADRAGSGASYARSAGPATKPRVVRPVRRGGGTRRPARARRTATEPRGERRKPASSAPPGPPGPTLRPVGNRHATSNGGHDKARTGIYIAAAWRPPIGIGSGAVGPSSRGDRTAGAPPRRLREQFLQKLALRRPEMLAERRLRDAELRRDGVRVGAAGPVEVARVEGRL